MLPGARSRPYIHLHILRNAAESLHPTRSAHDQISVCWLDYTQHETQQFTCLEQDENYVVNWRACATVLLATFSFSEERPIRPVCWYRGWQCSNTARQMILRMYKNAGYVNAWRQCIEVASLKFVPSGLNAGYYETFNLVCCLKCDQPVRMARNANATYLRSSHENLCSEQFVYPSSSFIARN